MTIALTFTQWNGIYLMKGLGWFRIGFGNLQFDFMASFTLNSLIVENAILQTALRNGDGQS